MIDAQDVHSPRPSVLASIAALDWDQLWIRYGLAFTLLVNALIGAGAAHYLFTKKFMKGVAAYSTWPTGDIEMFLTAGRYFIRDSWHFPLFTTPMIERSYTQSLVFMDCVPLAALIAKLIHSATGVEIAFISWWYALSVVLQPVTFAFMLWMGNVRNAFLLLIGGVFALLVPAWLYRLGHSALFGNFILIVAIGLFLASVNFGRERKIWSRWLYVAWACWLAVAATSSGYLFAMAVGFFVAAVVQTMLFPVAAGSRKALVGYAIGVFVGLLAWLYALGFFVPYFGGGEFGIHSMNLLSPFIPQRTTLFADSLGFVDATGGQYEGFNYFGAGFLALLVVAIAFGNRRLWPALRRQPILIAALTALTLFALSNVGYAGHRLMWSFPAPKAFETFRSSGRFFWPVTYFAMFAAFYLLEGVVSLGRASLAIVACLVLQWEDTRYLSDGVYNLGHILERPHLNTDPDGLRSLIAKHKGVYVAPDYACAKSERINRSIMDLAWYAASENKTINTANSSRAPLDYSCAIDAAIVKDHLDKGYLVVTAYENGDSTPPPDGLVCGENEQIKFCLGSSIVPLDGALAQRLFAPH